MVHRAPSVGAGYQQFPRYARDQLPRFQSGIPDLQNDGDESIGLATRRSCDRSLHTMQRGIYGSNERPSEDCEAHLGPSSISN